MSYVLGFLAIIFVSGLIIVLGLLAIIAIADLLDLQKELKAWAKKKFIKEEVKKDE